MYEIITKIDRIFELGGEEAFNALSLEVFLFQYANSRIYKQFVDYLGINPFKIFHYSQIPFLPIEFFKSHKIHFSKQKVEKVFGSSGTTSLLTSKHYVTDLTIYKQSFMNGFQYFYSRPSEYCFLALLPSYLEKGDSSLLYMFEHLIQESKYPQSGFYLNHKGDLINRILELKRNKIPTILIGVSYALMDFAEDYPMDLSHLTVMETGGMKGRRKEMVKEELHQQLINAFELDTIHSEYGMTELLSQAYSKGKNIFQSPPWMKILIRDTNDPLHLLPTNQTGGINVIDLANINSCSFIATQDIGKLYPDNTFEVLGRFDDSDIRGCNLLIN